MDIKWIFFDVGSTLVDETKAYDHRAKEMLQNISITFDEFDNKRIEFAKLGYDGNSQAIKYFQLEKTPWPSAMEVPFADAANTLETLKKRDYNLGIIANQITGTKQRFESWNLLKHFDIFATSAELGVAKPDKLIFQKALELAKCEPTHSVMIGDRLDNDIRPAKNLGMKTVWIRKGLSMYQNKDLGKNVADWIIDNLSDLLDIFK